MAEDMAEGMPEDHGKPRRLATLNESQGGSQGLEAIENMERGRTNGAFNLARRVAFARTRLIAASSHEWRFFRANGASPRPVRL